MIRLNKKKNFALIGYPLGHSLSPAIHNELCKIGSTNADYDIIEVQEKDLEKVYDNNLRNLDGFNVTIPHKINIIPLLDELSDKARLFGAVNTVANRSGKMIGYNTDCIGFINSLKYSNIELNGDILICGSGGVSRMFAFESILAGANITIAVRETGIEAAKKLKKEIDDIIQKNSLSNQCKIAILSDIRESYDLIINGTPVGMYPNVNACPISENVIKSSKAVFDAIYNPINTKLVFIAKENGLKVSNGLPMLVWQAAIAEKIWNDISFSNEDISNVINIAEKLLI